MSSGRHGCGVKGRGQQPVETPLGGLLAGAGPGSVSSGSGRPGGAGSPGSELSGAETAALKGNHEAKPGEKQFKVREGATVP